MIKDFRHACLIVSDLDKSLKFYQDILGLRVSKTLTVNGNYPETAFNIKGVKITYVKMLSPNQSEDDVPIFELHFWHNPKIRPKPRYDHISFTVDNLESEYKRLKKSGTQFISKPIAAPDKKTKICFGYDPDNNLIEFVEEL